MSQTRWLLVIGFAAYAVYMVIRGFTGYTSVVGLTVPSGVAAKSVTVHCGAPFGSARVHGPATTPYPLSRSACDTTQMRIILPVDVLLGLLGIAVVTSWGRWTPFSGPQLRS